MGRTPKSGLDWFQCDVDIHESDSAQALTMAVGRNNGIAFLITLFSMIGRSKGQYIDCNQPSQWRIFASKTGLKDDEVIACLNTLADLETIDSDVWRTRKIIVCPQFVERHRSYYSKSFSLVLPDSDPAQPEKVIPANKNVTVEESAFGPVEVDHDWMRVEEAYAKQIGELPMGKHLDDVLDLYHELGADLLILAAEEANRNVAQNPKAYFIKILKNWRDKGVRTVAQAQAEITEHKNAKKKQANASQRPQGGSGGDPPEDVKWL